MRIKNNTQRFESSRFNEDWKTHTLKLFTHAA